MGRAVALVEEPPFVAQKHLVGLGAQELLGTSNYNVLMHDLWLLGRNNWVCMWGSGGGAL